MKKLLISVVFAANCAGAIAQSLQTVPATIINDRIQTRTVAANRTVGCNADTLLYAQAKATSLIALAMNNSSSVGSVAQYFDCPQPVTISGATLYAWKANAIGGISMDVSVEIYNVTADSLPTGSPLASAILAVDTVFGSGSLSDLQRNVSFGPITVSQPYCVVVTNPFSYGLNVVVSSSGDGQQEWLASAKIGNTWRHGYDLVIGSTYFNSDVLLQPVVSYDLTADFSLVGLTCVPENGAAQFTNTSSPVLFNRMYSTAELLDLSPTQFSWDYGDGSALDHVVNGAHTYSGSPPWNVTLTDTLFGWTMTCVDAKTISTADQVEADFVSVTNGLVVNFTDETVGPNINGWSWDFGDGNSSTESDPTHAYASEGSYSVCLVSNSDCNSDTICQTVVVSMVSVAEDGVDFGLHIYPNPSVGQFTVELDALNEDVTAHVTDVAGRVLSTCVIPMNVTKKNFSLDLSAGTYLIRFNTQNAVVARKLQVTP